MQASSLQLEKYFFTRLHVDACREKNWTENSQLSTNVECGRHHEEPRRFKVVLQLQLGPENNNAPAYEVDCEVVGLFRVVDECPEENVVPLVHVNAPSLLFGVAREMIATVTARGPHPAFILPTMSFVDHTEKLNPAAASGEAKKKQSTAGKTSTRGKKSRSTPKKTGAATKKSPAERPKKKTQKKST